ncbi:unnamed protein product [Candidula unifasciata]|uniref:tRNA (adenine(58)-N(1))-methyltransferase catalytic subunit TRMT61A n=1 Tax=Candidula unifasciata TaxID=100452 RepID=A0A8S4A0P4_9EUPU|nr:unnamed protein product [Candidula unifasciata]
MSFRKMKDTIDYGDTVILHIGYDNMLPIMIAKGETMQTKFGAVKHSSLVGKQYGTKIQCSKGWVFVLQPTPELWTLSLPHRTQILYSTDISMIIFQLDLKPGSIVAEAGTGSGSLSHAILRTIQPSGQLLTFEFHGERCDKARQEFAEHGLSEFVTVTHRDVCGEGFQLDHLVDAVFLDLPKPWECIASAKNAIKREGGRICTFSPCIEQVQRSCEELSKNNFTDIVTVECLARNFNIQYAKLQNVLPSDVPLAANGDSVNCGTEEDESKQKSHKKVKKAPESFLNKAQDNQVKTAVHNYCFSSAIPTIAMQGHTGFLTFASLYYH